ncbi:hypothetical protein FHS90_000871 [Rufibacter quisquiliarum]|uniref:Uncharacterized protein n=1 Tax=Rufibacter quisquiliarum TaxID=1549639 RepID=A0A839GHJ0_9BACT|nr:hypothetical protein [Rufibacter quisquiliarum]
MLEILFLTQKFLQVLKTGETEGGFCFGHVFRKTDPKRTNSFRAFLRLEKLPLHKLLHFLRAGQGNAGSLL